MNTCNALYMRTQHMSAHTHTHIRADTHNDRYRRLAQKHWLQGLKQRCASQSPERRRFNPLGSQGPDAPTSTTRCSNQMHEAHKMLLRELKAYSPSPDSIERMALAVQHTSQEVVAALRADAILNNTTGANADIPTFAFLLADAEYHEAAHTLPPRELASKVSLCTSSCVFSERRPLEPPPKGTSCPIRWGRLPVWQFQSDHQLQCDIGSGTSRGSTVP
jgi:hypothetical protein